MLYDRISIRHFNGHICFSIDSLLAELGTTHATNILLFYHIIDDRNSKSSVLVCGSVSLYLSRQ